MFNILKIIILALVGDIFIGNKPKSKQTKQKGQSSFNSLILECLRVKLQTLEYYTFSGLKSARSNLKEQINVYALELN